MRAHLDATIENESVRRIYSEYWVGSTAAELRTVGREAMTEERGRDDCEYFAWFAALPWPDSEPEPVDDAPLP